MKQKRLIFLIGIGYQLLAIGYSPAQSFKLVKATSQNLSGGVAGQRGSYYRFEIQTNSKKLTPDTIWINNSVYPIDISGKNKGVTCSLDSVTHTITYSIALGESHFDFNRPPKSLKKDTTAKPTKPVKQFDGAAMISYRIKNKQHFYIVKSFTQLTPISYP